MSASFAEMRALLPRLAQGDRGSFGFFGPEHIGKRGLAEEFARLLLDYPAPQPLEGHPDFALLDAAQDGGTKDLKTWLERIHQTSARGGKRVFMIDHADELSMAALNALLKDLEEPRAGVVFVVIAAREAGLPATIRSRLVPLRLRQPSASEAEAFAEAQGLPKAWAKEALYRPGLLLRRNLDAAWWESLQAHVESIDEAIRHELSGQLIAALDTWQKTLEKREDALQQWRILLIFLMDKAKESLPRQAKAYAQAWSMLGSAIPPRVALEQVLAQAAFPEESLDVHA